MKKYQWVLSLSLFIGVMMTNVSFAQFSGMTLIEEGSSRSSLGSSLEDLDNDGDLDVISRYKNAAYWFENDGVGHFSSDQEFIRFADSKNRRYAFVDIDGDGIKDFIMGKFWKKGLGAGEYEPKAGLLSVELAYMSDIDNDGLIDALYYKNSKIYWQKNQGTGSFSGGQVLINEDVSVYQPLDINNDGANDLIVRKNGQLLSYIYVSAGNYQSTLLLDYLPTALLTKDFNGDGVVDLLLAHSGQILWYEFSNDGTITLKQTISHLYGSGGLSMGDLDYDGKEDLFVGNIRKPFIRARYFHFDSTGLFDTLARNHSSSLGKYNGSEIADLNGDGHNDLFINQHSISMASWIKNVSAGFFKGAYPIQKIFNRLPQVYTLDVDGDQDDDIWTDRFLFKNLGDGQFAEKEHVVDVVGYQYFKGDLDGDSLADIVFPKGDSIYWKKNLGNTIFGSPVAIDAWLPMCHAVSGGDFDGDGDIDLIAGHGSDLNGSLYLFENDGLGQFLAQEIISGAGKMNKIDVMDGDGDGDIDFEIFILGDPYFFSNYGNATFQYLFENFPYEPELWPFVSQKSQSLVIDLDGDGFRDYIVSNQKTSKTQTIWYRYLGDGNISEKKVLLEKKHQGSYSSMYFTVFDANLDGILDLVISHGYHRQLFYLEGLGAGTFADEVLIFDESGYGNFGGLAATDVDGDGFKEVILADRFDGFDRLSYLKNSPLKKLETIFSSATCDNNGTPEDPSDDRVILQIKTQGPGSGCLLSFSNGITADITQLEYDSLTTVTLSPESAGDMEIVYKIQDLTYFTKYYYYGIANPGTCSVVSNENLDESTFVEIFPNPSSGQVNIVNALGASLWVYDMMGKLVHFKDKILAKEQVELTEGIYFLQILGKKGIFTERVVVLNGTK